MVHGDVYDYSRVVYKNRRTNVDIICPVHGVFSQNPESNHRGHKCLKCTNHALLSSTSEFITKARLVHGDTYDYVDTNYTGVFKKVIITCKIHNNFLQVANDHLAGSGCRKCAIGGFNTSKDGSLYIQSVSDDDNNLICYKVGISDNPQRRVNQINITSRYNHELIWHFSSNGEFIKNLETKIHRECKRYNIDKSLVPDGYTELIELCEIEKVFSIIRKSILNH